MLKLGKTLASVLLLTLTILATALAIPIRSQINVISIYISGGNGGCYFREGDKDYGWS